MRFDNESNAWRLDRRGSTGDKPLYLNALRPRSGAWPNPSMHV